MEKHQIIFSSNGSRQQYFPFPSDVIKIILKNISSPDLYQKLIKTCKYLYCKNRVIVHECGIRYNCDYKSWIPSKLFRKVRYQHWLKQELICVTSESIIVSTLLQKVYKCNFDTLDLKYQQLTFGEYLLLTSSKTVKDFYMYLVTISYVDGRCVPFEKLMKQFPNVRFCNFLPDNNHESYFTSQTAQNLLNLPVFKDLQLLKLFRINECFDYISFSKFIKKNFTSDYVIIFYYTTPEEYRKNFTQAVDKMLNEWHTSAQKPEVVYWKRW